MPYSMLLGLSYILSGASFSYALKKLSGSNLVAILSYLFLIYSPTGFSVEITQRLYRNAIIFPSVLLVLSCILLVYAYREDTIKKQIVYLVLLGLSFLWFYYIREDSFWMWPLLLGSLIVIAVWNCFFSKSGHRTKKNCLLVIPVFIFLAGTTLYKYTNYINYGIWGINDRAAGTFSELTGNMIKINDESDAGINYWISKDTLERIIDACPSLSENKERIMDQYALWSDESGNVKGDWSVWAIREAFSSLGHYSDAVTISEFCEKVNEELISAVEEGKLCWDSALHFTSQSRGIYISEIPGFISETIQNIWNVGTFKDVNAQLIESSGSYDEIRYMESIMGVRTINPSQDDVADINIVYSKRTVDLSNCIIELIRKISLILLPISIMGFFVLVLLFIRNKKWENFEPLIIESGILLSVFLYEFGVTVFNSWLGAIGFYSTGAVPLIQCFEMLSVVYCFKILKRRRRNIDSSRSDGIF